MKRSWAFGVVHHAKQRQVGPGADVELREARLAEGAQDLARAVGAEVEAEYAVAVLHSAVVTDDPGEEELVSLAIGIVRGDGVRAVLARSPLPCVIAS
jgi:thymidine phosphorylase